MSKQITLERFKEPLLELLDETFSTTHGLFLDRGTSLFDTIQNVSADEASQSSSVATSTIAAQVDHVRFYLDVLTDIIRTKRVIKIDWRDIWQRDGRVNQEEWNSIRAQLKLSHQKVLDTINQFEAWDGEYDLAGPLSILAHTAYHLGGIRQALGVVRARSKAQTS